MIKAYTECDGILLIQSSLFEALGIWAGCRVISFVGAGGKTSLMYQLADELSRMGKRVIVTTSTHIANPKQKKVICPQNPSRMNASDWEELWTLFREEKEMGVIPEELPNYLVAGKPALEGKLSGFEMQEIGTLLEGADFLLIEADGAKRLPLKVPAMHEPVIIPKTDLVVACAGLDSVGRPLKEACFRLREAEFFLGKPAHERICAEDVASIMASDCGGRKLVGERSYCVVLNKADNQKRMETALQIAGLIREKLPLARNMESLAGAKNKQRLSGAKNRPSDLGNEGRWKYRCIVTAFANVLE